MTKHYILCYGIQNERRNQMTKNEVIKGMVALIDMVAKRENLTIDNKGVGHGFDNTVWKTVAKDTSEIPTIDAVNADGTYQIGMRPFWSSPEICVRRKTNRGEELLIFHFSDYKKTSIDGEYVHTGNYTVGEVRVDSKSDYKKLIDETYEMIDYVVEHGKGE